LPINSRRPLDLKLLDTIDLRPREQFAGSAWRVVRADRDPLQGSPAGGRWDPGTFDVLYTSLDQNGAMAEMNFHLSRLPLFPSKMRWLLHRLTVNAKCTLKFADFSSLEALKVCSDRYPDVLYPHTQAIGDAARHLGFDSLIAPSARWECLNLVLFTDHLDPGNVIVESAEEISWDDWHHSSGLLK